MRRSARRFWCRSHASRGPFFGQGGRTEQPFFTSDDQTADSEHEADRVADSLLRGDTGRPAIRATPKGPKAQGDGDTGRPLSSGERRWFEPRLGADLSAIRLHEGPEAGSRAEAMGARAFAEGSDISFAPGAYRQDTPGGRRLLAHELTHSLQQARSGRSAIQREVASPAPGAVTTPADLPAGQRWHVVVIGSPGPGEQRAGHADQFIRAAERHPFSALGSSPAVVWLVERTGHGLAGISASQIRARGPRYVFFIDEDHSLPELIGAFPTGSIVRLNAYSHGLPGLMTLRYGWPGLPNYGLSLSDARSLTPLPFATDATLTFDSCNSGTDVAGGVSLSQTVADATQRRTEGWTGRTSYRRVNAERWPEDREVVASEVLPSGGSPDVGELGSQLAGRVPRETQFTPRFSSGSFSSTFDISARLPESRHFPVARNGSVRVVLLPEPEHPRAAGLAFFVTLWRVGYGLFARSDDDNGGSRRVRLAEVGDLEWRSLPPGTYFIELYHPHGIHVRGPISVTVRR